MALKEWDELKRIVAEAEDDVAKAIGGNRAAGTRARKKMQDIKTAAQEVRKKILEGRQDGEGDAPAGDNDDSNAAAPASE